MKKKITILFLMLITSVVNVFSSTCGRNDFWGSSTCGLHDNQEYINGQNNTAASFLEKSGKIKTLSINTSSTKTSEGEISLTVNGSFYNYYTFTHASNYWYIAQFNVFDITYKVEQKDNSRGTWSAIYTETETQSYNPNISNNWGSNYHDEVKERVYDFNKTIQTKLSYRSNVNSYNIRVSVEIIPAYKSITDDSSNKNSHYCSSNYYSDNHNFVEDCRKNHSRTSNELTFSYDITDHQITTTNGYKNLTYGNYHLIYDDDNAIIELSLPIGNITNSKDGKPGYSAFMVGVNSDYILPSSISWCGNPYNGEQCNQPQDWEYIAKSNSLLINEMKSLSKYGKTYARFKGTMLQKEVSSTGVETIIKPTIVPLSKNENSENWYTKRFYLSDIKFTSNKNIASGSKIYINHRLLFSNWFNDYPEFSALGYVITPTYSFANELVTTNDAFHQTSGNTLNYYVIPKATFEELDNTNLKIKYVCVPNASPSNDNEIIILNNHSIKSIDNSIDERIYTPEYYWEFSYDTSNWKEINENDFIIPNFNIDRGDVYINPNKFLKDKDVVYFRRSAALKTFSSNVKSNLYSKLIDNLYYINIESTQYYTYKKLPTPTTINNFGMLGGTDQITSDNNKIYESSNPYNGKQIYFYFDDYKLNPEEYDALNEIANSTITITKNDGSQEIINGGIYEIKNYKKGEWKFDCRIEFCNGTSIGKSFTINSYPRIYFPENDRPKEIYKIYSENKIVNDEKYIISLKSDVIKTTNPNLTNSDLSAEYSWVFSYDKKNWKQIDEKYIVNPTIAIDNGDTHISSLLLEDKDVVYIRQKTVLKAFSQNTEDNYFTELIDNKYYLAATGSIYTINKLSNITEDNIQFTSGAGYASEDMKTCFDDAANTYNDLNIEFDIIGDANLSPEELEALRDNAKYSISRTKITWDGKETTEDVTKSRTPNKHTVSGFTSDIKAFIYTCKVESNNQTFSKTITLESYPEEKISMDKISTPTKGATITNIDGAQYAVYAMCPKGEDFKIKYFLDKDADRVKLEQYWARVKYDYPPYPKMVPYEDVVPFVPYSDIEPEPVFVPTDYDAIDILDLYDMIRQDADLRNEIETYYGVSIGRIDESILKNYLANKERAKFEAELAEYRLREQAHKDAYEADKQAYIDDYNAKEAAYNAEWEQKVGWKEFKEPDFYTTTLENITENEEEAEFLIRTQTKDGGCYSNEVTIKVTYFDGITDNTIAFVDDNIKDKQEIIVTAGEGNPYIKGELAKGAYGIPYIEGNCTYTYIWKYLDTKTNTWEVLTDAEGNEFKFIEEDEKTGNRPSIATQYISLNAGTIADISAMFPNGIEISRFVYSQRGNDANSKLEHQSNVLKITSAKPIAEDTFDYSLDEKFCPGAGNVYVTFKDVELNENEVLNATIKGEEDLPMVFDYEQKQIIIANPTKDFSVLINRIDTITNVKSNAIVLDIEIPEFKADFSVYVDYIEHSLNEDRINVQPGSRVVLFNNTINEMGSTVYNWTLQVQKDDYRGQSSEKEEPVCYLYNPGINKIILEATTANKCKSTVVADNIFVVNAESRNLPVSSYFEENMDQMLASEATISVYPTILNDEDMVNIKSNIEQYDVVISDIVGKVMLTAENLSMSSTLDVAHLPNGVYILNAANKSFKLIKK